jgi:hypothetical protein
MRLDEIVISKRFLFKSLSLILIPVILTLIGQNITPRGNDGSLLFLSPRVAQIAAYQNSVQRWAGEIRAAQGAMQNILNRKAIDLFRQDIEVQDAVRRTQNLTTSIDSTPPPDTLLGLRSLMLDAAYSNEQAALAIAVWASAPSGASLQDAEDSILLARSTLTKVYSNPWVTVQTP